MFYLIWRTLAQAAVGYALTKLALLGFTLDKLAAWGVTIDREALTAAVFALGIAAYAAAAHWLETRPGDGFWARTARLLARMLMLGAGKAPVYAAPGESVLVRTANGDRHLARDRLQDPAARARTK